MIMVSLVIIMQLKRENSDDFHDKIKMNRQEWY